MAEAKNNKIKPAMKFVSTVAQAVLVFAGLDYLLRAEYEPTVILVAAALAWVCIDLALYVYRYVVVPSAQAISKDK